MPALPGNRSCIKDSLPELQLLQCDSQDFPHKNSKVYFLYKYIKNNISSIPLKNRLSQCGPQNLLHNLPGEFSKEEYYQMRTRCGKLGKGDSTLRVWMSRGYVEWDEIAGKYINKKSRVS